MDFPSLIDRDTFIDCETTGLRWVQDQVFGVSVRVGGTSRYWDTRRTPNVIKWLKAELPRARKVINHNLKFDVHFLREEGIVLPDGILECTMVQAALIDEHELSFDLDGLCSRHLGRRKQDIVPRIKELLELKKNLSARKAMAELHRMPAEVVAEYANIDTELAELLYNRNTEEIEKQNLAQVWDLERRLMPVLIRMEERGVQVDLDAAHKADKELTRQIDQLQRKVNKAAGFDFNINSAPQMRRAFDPKKQEDGRWAVEVPGRAIYVAQTEGGAPSLDRDALRRIPGDLPADILELRQLLKIRDTFVRKHVLGWHIDGVVHCNYNQTKGDNEAGTGTGRLSVNDPALQQIPKRNARLAAIARALFIPYDGQKWASADWDQFEFRWFAHYTNNPTLFKMYQENPDTDFHQAVADLTGLPRSAKEGIKGNAKQINLGLVFGMGKGRMAQEMGLPYEEKEGYHGKKYLVPGDEAEALFKQYHARVPGVREMLENADAIASSRGYVKTALGRHIRFPGGKATHKAAGLVFQGTSADCMKEKMIELDREFDGTDTSLLLSVHDETDFSLYDDPKVTGRIKEILETFDGERCRIKCRIPIRTTVTVADNWWEASK